MNVSSIKTKGYEDVRLFRRGENKPNQTQSPGRLLTDKNIEHYQQIIVAINKTIEIMKTIDETIAAHGAWPIK